MSVPLIPSAAAVGPEPGTEPNLYLLECGRCGEPMFHFYRLEAEYPLCIWWAFKCGECGHRVDAWEDKPVNWQASQQETALAGYDEEAEEKIDDK